MAVLEMPAEVGVDDARELLFDLGVTGPNGKPLSRATLRALALAGAIRGRKVSKAQTSAWLYDVADLRRFSKAPRNPVGNPYWIAAGREAKERDEPIALPETD
ncbi:MAG: hypothetical protein FWC87_00080 [Acidimicrobiaceae bacterium]|nr:hypothetical protein [Acidimicrobiaceae bacterium]